MRRYCKLASVCALFLLAVSLSASAGSINNFDFENATLTGVSKGGTVSGSFSFNSKTDQFSNISISFVSSVFGTVDASDPRWGNGSYQGKGWWEFTWKPKVDGDTIVYSMLFNTITGQFQASGSIANWQNQKGNFDLSVPEGGTPLSYLMLSGLAVFAGILISGKQRRAKRTAQSG
jgi:hypothetical protein